MEASTETKNKKSGFAQMLFALTALIILRILPLLKSPLGTYGYDYGFYLYAIKHLAPLSVNTWLTALWGGYNNPLFYLTGLFRIPPAIVLSELYFFCAVLLGLSFYWFFKPYAKTGVLAVALTAFSIIEIEVYTMYLWKNLVALPFLILSFKFIHEKKWRALIFSSLAIALTHRTTLIIYALTVSVYLIIQLLRQKKIKLLTGLVVAGLLVCAAGFYWFHFKSIIYNLIENNNYFVRTGLFLEGQNLLMLLWPFLLLSLPGLYLYVKNRQPMIAPIFTAICLLWFVFQLPFYRRFLIYLDLSMIIYGAYFLGRFNYRTWLGKIALTVILVFLGYQAVNFTLIQFPLISPADIQEIQNFNRPGGFVLIASANDASWVLGYGHDERLGAPGLFEDPHTYQEWVDFWNGQNQRTFLSYYPRPLYLYQRTYHLPPFGVSQCLLPITASYSQVDYACLEKTLP